MDLIRIAKGLAVGAWVVCGLAMQADGRALGALMQHVRSMDETQQTVLMVQVENEVGYLGYGRDRSKMANEMFRGAVPAELMKALEAKREEFSPELRAHFDARGKTWAEVFGDAADEVFMAWNYARYIQAVAAEGKRAYALPTYANCQLPAADERAGEYPSGGPQPAYLEVYRVTATGWISFRRIFTGRTLSIGSTAIG